MNLEIATGIAAGIVIGISVGWWRATVYARKLRHFNISLDDWAHYDTLVRQGRVKRPRPVTPMYGTEDE